MQKVDFSMLNTLQKVTKSGEPLSQSQSFIEMELRTELEAMPL